MYYSQLRAFHAVATQGGFSKAARHLGLTQPAISDQVRKLESWFNVLLFNRQKRGVSTTELGLALLEITHRMFETEAQAIELLSETNSLNTGHLKIAADAPSHVLRIVARFRQRHPGIALSMSHGNSVEISRQLFDFQADIGVLAKVPDDPRLQVISLRRDPLVAFVAKSPAWAGRKSISLKQLGRQDLVLREAGSITRDLLQAEFARKNITPRVAIEVDGRESAREAVAAGIGVGVVSAPEFDRDDRLQALAISDSEAAMTEYLVCLKDRCHLAAIAAFIDCTQAVLAEAAAG